MLDIIVPVAQVVNAIVVTVTLLFNLIKIRQFRQQPDYPAQPKDQGCLCACPEKLPASDTLSPIQEFLIVNNKGNTHALSIII
ncbi:MAG: hypothetical protein JXB60_04605 [Candidatus Cloacimonetes bacterium]|nr:hypothetical protein [Candidatus Cloacimonadota bacterium]